MVNNSAIEILKPDTITPIDGTYTTLDYNEISIGQLVTPKKEKENSTIKIELADLSTGQEKAFNDMKQLSSRIQNQDHYLLISDRGGGGAKSNGYVSEVEEQFSSLLGSHYQV